MSSDAQPTANSLPATRSCQRCNQKKIRCNKTNPCDGCSKSNSECIFPAPGRVPRRRKRPLKAELVTRLQGLQQEIRELVNERTIPVSQDFSSLATSLHEPPAAGNSQDVGDQWGKLVIAGDSTQYVTHEALAGLENQIGEFKELFEALGDDTGYPDETIDDQNADTIQSGTQFCFGYSSMSISLQGFHPSMAHSKILWKTFEQNVAPMVTIFHLPSLLKLMYKGDANSSYIDRPSEAVVFAVYFAAISSMEPTECEGNFDQNHASMVQHYKFATQQALARADFLQSRSITVLQATVLFFTCLHRSGDTYFVWTMTAAVLRLAKGIGLHRDGTNFGMSPFDVEMRRRLWWSIYLLDSQSSELHATGPLISENSYDTKLFLNINDSDISPASTQPPEERSGFSEMTFSLVRIEMISLCRRYALNPAGGGSSGNPDHEIQDEAQTLETQLRRLEIIRIRLQERYLQFCDISDPLQWVTATIIRLALTRSYLIVHFSPETTADQLPFIEMSFEHPKRYQLFSTAVEVVEFAYLLETDPRTTKWAWFFKGYPQWHAVMFVLSDLCNRSETPEMLYAWCVVEKAVTQWIKQDLRKEGITLKAVNHLMKKAAASYGRVWPAR